LHFSKVKKIAEFTRKYHDSPGLTTDSDVGADAGATLIAGFGGLLLNNGARQTHAVCLCFGPTSRKTP
jgi:hypothetical protein